MKLLKLNQKGFSHVEMGTMVVVILVIAAVGVKVLGIDHADPLPSPSSTTASATTANTANWTKVDSGTICMNESCTSTANYAGYVCKTEASSTYYVKGMAEDTSQGKANGFFPIGSYAQIVDAAQWSENGTSIQSTEELIYTPKHALGNSSAIDLTVTADNSYGNALNRNSVVKISNVSQISSC